MSRHGDTPVNDEPPAFSWTDAVILSGAVLAVLIGVSLISFQGAIVLALLAMAFVIYKLLTTKA